MTVSPTSALKRT